MRELKAPLASRKDIEALEGAIAVEAHLYRIGPISYPHYVECKALLEKRVEALNACFINEDQRNFEALSIEIKEGVRLLIVRDKRKNKEYFDSLEKV